MYESIYHTNQTRTRFSHFVKRIAGVTNPVTTDDDTFANLFEQLFFIFIPRSSRIKRRYDHRCKIVHDCDHYSDHGYDGQDGWIEKPE